MSSDVEFRLAGVDVTVTSFTAEATYVALLLLENSKMLLAAPLVRPKEG